MDFTKHQQYYVDQNRSVQATIIRLQEENVRLRREIEELKGKLDESRG